MSLPGKPTEIKSIKIPVKHFYLIKSETSDSIVNHFDGHFAYLKTLDFYFKQQERGNITAHRMGEGVQLRKDMVWCVVGRCVQLRKDMVC